MYFLKKKTFVYLNQFENKEFWIAIHFSYLLVIIVIHSRENRDIKTDTAIFKHVTREQKTVSFRTENSRSFKFQLQVLPLPLNVTDAITAILVVMTDWVCA